MVPSSDEALLAELEKPDKGEDERLLAELEKPAVLAAPAKPAAPVTGPGFDEGFTHKIPERFLTQQGRPALPPPPARSLPTDLAGLAVGGAEGLLGLAKMAGDLPVGVPARTLGMLSPQGEQDIAGPRMRESARGQGILREVEEAHRADLARQMLGSIVSGAAETGLFAGAAATPLIGLPLAAHGILGAAPEVMAEEDPFQQARLVGQIGAPVALGTAWHTRGRAPAEVTRPPEIIRPPTVPEPLALPPGRIELGPVEPPTPIPTPVLRRLPPAEEPLALPPGRDTAARWGGPTGQPIAAPTITLEPRRTKTQAARVHAIPREPPPIEATPGRAGFQMQVKAPEIEVEPEIGLPPPRMAPAPPPRLPQPPPPMEAFPGRMGFQMRSGQWPEEPVPPRQPTSMTEALGPEPPMVTGVPPPSRKAPEAEPAPSGKPWSDFKYLEPPPARMEKVKYVEPSGKIEAIATEAGDPQFSSSWYSGDKTRLVNLRAEGEHLFEARNRRTYQKLFGMDKETFKKTWRQWMADNPLVSEAIQDIREGIPLTPERAKAYAANKAKADEYYRIQYGYLDEANASGIPEHSLGPTYTPWEAHTAGAKLKARQLALHRPGMSKWSHMDFIRQGKVRPAQNVAEVFSHYLDDFDDMVVKKPELDAVIKMRDEAAPKSYAATKWLNDWIKNNIKDERATSELVNEDIKLSKLRNELVKEGDTIQADGGVGEVPGTYKVLAEKAAKDGDPMYLVEVNGKVQPQLFTKEDLIAIKHENTVITAAPDLSGMARRVMGVYFVGFNPSSSMKALLTNPARVAAGIDVRDWATAMGAAAKAATGAISKEKRTLYEDVGAIAAKSLPEEMIGKARTVGERAAFWGVTYPDMVARVGAFEASMAKSKRIHPDWTEQQHTTWAKVEMSTMVDIADTASRSPHAKDWLWQTIRFLQGSAMRTMQQAADVAARKDVAAPVKAGIAFMLTAYPAYAAMGGTWEDLKNLVIGSAPFIEIGSGNVSTPLGAPGMALGELKKGYQRLTEAGPTEWSEYPMPVAARRIGRAIEEGSLMPLTPLKRPPNPVVKKYQAARAKMKKPERVAQKQPLWKE